MNISRYEQRVLHVLAQGGHLQHLREDGPRITGVICYTRDGFVLEDCTLQVFQKLRRKGLIASSEGTPYRISRLGRMSVRAQLDNRG
jgi:uncharacterized protein